MNYNFGFLMMNFELKNTHRGSGAKPLTSLFSPRRERTRFDRMTRHIHRPDPNFK